GEAHAGTLQLRPGRIERLARLFDVFDPLAVVFHFDADRFALDFRPDGDDAVRAPFIAVDDRVGHRFGDDRLDVHQFVQGRVQLRHEGRHRHPGERFVFRQARKLQRHGVAEHGAHSATSSPASAACSLGAIVMILNSPLISNNRTRCGATSQTTIRPPLAAICLYRPRMTPSPELSMKDSSFRLSTTFFVPSLSMASSMRAFSKSAVWWSSSPFRRTISAFRCCSSSIWKPNACHLPLSRLLPDP